MEVPKGQEVKHPARVMKEGEATKLVFYPATFNLLLPGSYKLKAYAVGKAESEPFYVTAGCELSKVIVIPPPYEAPPPEMQPSGGGEQPPPGEGGGCGCCVSP